jgi:hypothetical protein
MGRDLKIKPGPSGWVEATWPGGKVWARFEPDENRKLRRLAEMRVLEPTAESLRRIPVMRIARAVQAHSAVQLHLAIRLPEEPPTDLSAAFSGEGVPEPRRYRLKRPAGRRLDDRFFENVGRAYRGAVIRGLSPRKTLAADTGVAPDTVARWVLEARRRGHLPPGEPGKVTVDDRTSDG